MSKLKTVIRVVSFSALAIASSAGTALADEICEPDLQVDYVRGGGSSVKVTKLQYKLEGTSVWHQLPLTATVIDRSKSSTFSAVRLNSAVKGSKLKFRVGYKPDAGQGYGAETLSEVAESDRRCENNVKYVVPINIGQ